MDGATRDIDGIVDQVIHRLRQRLAQSDAQDNAGTASDESDDQANPSGQSPDLRGLAETLEANSNVDGLESLTISDRVVTLATIAGRLEGVSRVVLQNRAIVTPAAADELRQHRVTVTSTTTSGGQPNRIADAALVLAVAETDYCPASLLQALAGDHSGADHLEGRDLASVVGRLTEVVSGGKRLGLLLTGQPAAALCLANRRPSVRAALATGPQCVTAVVDSIGANVLVVDPTGRSLFQLVTMARRFTSPGQRTCPAPWREALEAGA